MLGPLLVLLATACWGTSGVFITLILATWEVSVLALAFWRALTTFLVLLVGLRLLRPAWLRVERGELIWFGILGASISVMQLLWIVAVLLNGAAVATVQQAAMPAIVTVAAWVLWREPLTARKVTAILLTFVGTAFVSGVNRLGQAHLSSSGFLAGLGLATVYAGWNIMIKKVRGRHNPFTTLTYQFGFGALVLLPFQFFTPQPQSLPGSVLLHFVGLIGLATIGGFSIYASAVGRLQASVASVLAMAEIPIVAVYAYILLGERTTIAQVLGAVLVVAGVLILSWRRDK
jgi:drug/metabolite transporter (DMT)-like permease